MCNVRDEISEKVGTNSTAPDYAQGVGYGNHCYIISVTDLIPLGACSSDPCRSHGSSYFWIPEDVISIIPGSIRPEIVRRKRQSSPAVVSDENPNRSPPIHHRTPSVKPGQA